MVLEILFAVALLATVVYVVVRIIGNITIGAVLVLIVFLASYLLMGSFPKLGDVPVIGQFIGQFIPTTGKAIAVIKNFAHSIEIIGTSRTSDGNLLVTVANTGKLDVSNFTAYVDGQTVNILNNKDSLKSGSVVVFELDWTEDFNSILIETDQTEAMYENKA